MPPGQTSIGVLTTTPGCLSVTSATIPSIEGLTDAGYITHIEALEVPYTVFTDPQVAGVGRTDAEAVRQGVPSNCHTLPFALLPKARVLRDVGGAIKMVVDDQTKRIVGIHLLAPHAGDIIMEGVVAMRDRWTIYNLIETVHVFPTLAETLKVAAQSFARNITKAACCVE